MPMDDAPLRIEPGHVRRRDVQEITTATDTREILANCARQTKQYGLDKWFIVDVDAHHVETDSWAEVIECIEDPVVRYNAKAMAKNWPDAKNRALTNGSVGLNFQDVSGRIPHQAALAEPVSDTSVHRDVTLARRAMEAMSIDQQVIFPQPMLGIGMHPSPNIETQLVLAYNKWFVETILAHEERVISMIPLPFRDVEACLRIVREYGHKKGVVGFCVTSQRQAHVASAPYMRLYAEIEATGKPLGFHAGPDYMFEKSVNRFLSMHALSFVTCNMVHLTNWVINGMCERFPKLKVIWIESGIAWLPFMMQRLDHEFALRQSDAPLLKKMPSEYITDMYYTTQPLEVTNMDLLKATFKAVKAETQLVYASDWPHWDFDPPYRIAGLPFVSEQGKRNILGETARKLFKL